MNKIINDHRLNSGQHLLLIQGDITEERVDAIVNAANAQLQHGGGVAGAIIRKGGFQIQHESTAWVEEHGPVRHENPAYTSAGDLNCKYVIHAVGPIWGDGDEDRKLQAAVLGCLKLADQLSLTSISLPAISTGIFGFPIKRAANLNFDVILDYFNKTEDSNLLMVRLVLYDQKSIDTFHQVWAARFAPS